MQISKSWLADFVALPENNTQLADAFSCAGLEVEAIEPVAGQFTDVVVGYVQSCEKHPEADRLNICMVDIGADALSQIVCGAKNVRADMKVPVATVGACLPGGLKIKKAKLRGVESNGMICSESELGLAESSAGIMPLPDDAPVGTALMSYLHLDDVSIHFELTPNRADCLSLMGLAREAGVIFNQKVTAVTAPKLQTTDMPVPKVHITDANACPTYALQIISGINNQATSPLALCEKLRRSGLRSISPAVDVTNYALLLTGQPLHAFDADKLQGDLCVRFAASNEKLTLLNEDTVELDERTLVIADDSGAIAIAGVMGGLSTAVDANTTTIALEAAHFNSEILAGTARRYGLHTDASHRFERGVDPELPLMSQAIAAQLLLEIAGGSNTQLSQVEVAGEGVQAQEPITLQAKHIEKLLGVSIADDVVELILTGLGCSVTRTEDSLGWQVCPPSFRVDLKYAVDLIEELARIKGYDAFEPVLPALVSQARPQVESFACHLAIKSSLVNRGFSEIVSYAFIAEADQSQFIQNADTRLKLANPLSPELAVMRQTALPGVLNAVAYNIKRQQSRVRLFELASCFSAEIQNQRTILAGAVTGKNNPTQWRDGADADFFALKADVVGLMQRYPLQSKLEFKAISTCDYLHPGKAADIFCNQVYLGRLGELHPNVSKHFKLQKQPVFVFELDIQALNAVIALPVAKPISDQPAVKRDLAFVVSDKIEAQALLSTVKNSAGNCCQSVELFDVYQGEGVDLGEKSLAFSLILQESSHTLKEDQVESIINRVIQNVQEQYSAKLRE